MKDYRDQINAVKSFRISIISLRKSNVNRRSIHLSIFFLDHDGINTEIDREIQYVHMR
jgi:hypothetical protein